MLLVAQAWGLGSSRARSLRPHQLCHWLAGNLGGAVNLFLQPVLLEMRVTGFARIQPGTGLPVSGRTPEWTQVKTE